MTERIATFLDHIAPEGGFKLKLDRVLLAMLLVLVGLFVFDRAQGWESLSFLGTAMLELSPFLIASVLIAAWVKATGCDALIGRAFSGKQGRAVVLAALAGALSPFCSCGVVPLIAALLSAGVPLAPVMAFWLASPIMDPEMFVLTSAVLGVELAVVKTLAAFFMGLLGGLGAMIFAGRGIFADPLVGIASTCGTGRIVRHEKPVWRFWQEGERVAKFWGETKSAGFFLGKWMALAFLLESIMIGYAPMDQIGEWLAGLGFWAIPTAAAVGVPAYMNGYAAIPFTDALMQLGLEAPAALSFMVAGGVTCIPAAVAVKALVRTSVFFYYLGIAAFGSISVGFAYAAYIAVS